MDNQRQDREDAATKAIQKARISMLIPRATNRLVWFGNMSTRLRLKVDWTMPTMATDGTYLHYNPDFTLALSKQQLRFVIAHEVMHCALLHPYRFEAVKGKYAHLMPPKQLHLLANIAADFAINAALIECGDSEMTAPKKVMVDGVEILADICYDKKYDGMNFEQILSALIKELQDHPKNSKPGPGPLDNVLKPETGNGGKGQGDKPGDKPGSDPAPGDGMTEADWIVANEDSKKGNGMQAGNVPGHIARSLQGAHEPVVPWRALMRRFITNLVPKDFTWSRPNRRFVHSGIYLPGMTKENIGELVICIDMSGSITDEWLNISGSELVSLCRQCKPEKVHVLYFDTVVSHHDTYTGNYSNMKLESHGGGGTAFQPFFDFVASAENKIKPVAMVVFTDLYCGDNPTEPKYPVLWIVPKGGKAEFKFGKVIPV